MAAQTSKLMSTIRSASSSRASSAPPSPTGSSPRSAGAAAARRRTRRGGSKSSGAKISTTAGSATRRRRASRRRSPWSGRARSSRATNSPDISFDRSINPYRGCEHGCFYCFARPSHAYLGLSAGLDFESKLFVKDGAAALLERELAAPKYRPRVIALGANTDAYQPIERQLSRHPLRSRSPRAGAPPRRHRHQVQSGPARPRPARADGGARPRQGVRLGDDARSRAWRAGWSRARRRPPAASRRSSGSPRRAFPSA